MTETELEEDWKDKYFKALMDQDDLEKAKDERFELLYKELLTAFGHFRGRDEAVDQNMVDLPAQSAAVEVSLETLKELNRQIADISDLIEEELPQSEKEKADPEVDPFAIARDSLEYFIEQLPAEVSKQLDLDRLTTSLNEIGDAESLRTIADDIKHALSATLTERNKKIKELSTFLGSVARRLDGLQSHLKEEKKGRKNSSDGRGDLSELVGNNLKQIRESVASAESINSLQQAIDSRLDEVDSKVTTFVEAESERADKAEKSSAALEAQLQKLKTQTNQLRQSLEAARTDAVVDPLTGVSNRRAYDERFQIEYSRWKRNHEPLTLAIMDIDYFKKINDTYGHPIGDKVLKVVAGRVQQQVRESDFFGRIGGEEFAFILVNSDIENSMEKVEILRKSVEDCNFSIKKKKFQVTMSIGLATFKGSDTIETIYSRADEALVKAKQTGRNKTLSELDL